MAARTKPAEIATVLISRTGENPERWVVRRNGNDIGLLEKYKDTKDETHPWKAFRGIGMACRYEGAFYGKDGREQAKAAVVA